MHLLLILIQNNISKVKKKIDNPYKEQILLNTNSLILLKFIKFRGFKIYIK